jgi:type II secretory ATPase GspE/PulE/Tfp pilus assembly ATPase PilB-like protein
MSDNKSDKVVSLPGAALEEAEVRKLAAEWGWSAPKPEILVLARRCRAALKKRAGDILVSWEVIDAPTRDRLLRTKPENIPTLHHMAEVEPSKVLPYVEQVLAMQNGVAFYEELNVLAPHPEMSNASVLDLCKKLDAALMLIEAHVPVLVFSRWDSMLNYSLMGVSDRDNDPVIKILGQIPVLAVGARNELSHVLTMHAAQDESWMHDNGARQWNVKSGGDNLQEHEKVLARLFDYALSVGASDVSFKPLRDGSVSVRVRKSGLLKEPFANGKRSMQAFVLNPETAHKAINLLLSKSAASQGIVLKEPADGQINYKSSTSDAFFRLNFIPLNHLGDFKQLRSVSVRLFPRKVVTVTLAELNIPEDVAQHIRDFIQMPQGLMVWSGPTNSGKSTTISAAVGEHFLIFGEEVKRMSVEDPIERHLDGITQINVPMHVEETKRFSVVLRALKRHDPDMLWIGEVRDQESAEFCVNFAGTGHLALTSLHANNSVGAYDVLSLGVSPDRRVQLIEAMTSSIAQRLVRTLCPKCSEAGVEPNAEEIRLFKLSAMMTGEKTEMPKLVSRVVNHEGCEECDNGYREEVPIFEVLPFTRTVKDAALARLFGNDPTGNKKIMESVRTTTLLESGMKLMAEGMVDLKSILFF